MTKIETACLGVVVALLLVTGVVKVVNPGAGAAIPESGQVYLGCAEVVTAMVIATQRKIRGIMVALCACGAVIGLVVHVAMIGKGGSCGCLGGFTPRDYGLSLAAALGMCSCLWLSLQRNRVRVISG